MKRTSLVTEFIRYVAVGGISFLVDSGVLALFREVVLRGMGEAGLYWAAAAGFLVGLAVNYALSLAFVFVGGTQREKGAKPGAVALFALIGLIGLGLTEAGMWLGVSVLGLHYLFVKIVVAALVLVWNYGARKVLIFR